jgi:low affinity Fe/Cu permease
MDTFRRALTQLGVLAAHALAFLIVATYGLLWFIFDREDFGWHGFAVLATWAMTLLIQRAEHRDTQAIHAKLDELLHAEAKARSDLVHIDDAEPEDIERLRSSGSDSKARDDDGQARGPPRT